MKTLMELVEKCKVAQGKSKDNTEVIDRALELEELGFKDVANKLIGKIELAEKLKKVVEYKYIKITETNIKEYLEEKVERYNREHKKKKRGSECMLIADNGYFGISADVTYSNPYSYFFKNTNNTEEPKHGIEIIVKQTNDYYSNNKNTIGRFEWTETPIDQYKTIPPQLVLDTLKTHQDRHIFDYFTIAKVNQVVDPLLLGRIEGITDRFFLCQWGEDVNVDDLI